MRRTRCGLGLVLLCLTLVACAHPQAARLQLPEPPLPACLAEQPPDKAEAVGHFEFTPEWVAWLKTLPAPRDVVMAVFGCTVETAKSLREAVSTIRMNNRPPARTGLWPGGAGAK